MLGNVHLSVPHRDKGQEIPNLLIITFNIWISFFLLTIVLHCITPLSNHIYLVPHSLFASFTSHNRRPHGAVLVPRLALQFPFLYYPLFPSNCFRSLYLPFLLIFFLTLYHFLLGSVLISSTLFYTTLLYCIQFNSILLYSVELSPLLYHRHLRWQDIHLAQTISCRR